MSARDRFWTRRLRWRLRGAWQWPTFGAITLLEGVVLHDLPPKSTGFPFVAGVILASFGNLFLAGAIAPWIGRRLEARDRCARQTGPPREVRVDRIATGLIVAGALGLTVTGLASRHLVVSETKATEEAGRLVSDYVAGHGSAEMKRNLDAANTYRIEPGYFRVCIPRDDRTKADCLYVSTKSKPPTTRRDPNPAPNGALFGRDTRR